MCLCFMLFGNSNVLFLFFRVESGIMNKEKTPMDPHTPSETREVLMFDPETTWKEVSNAEICRVRDGESIKDYRERMHMIKRKAERVCYDLELDLNKLYHLSESRRGVELTQGEPSEVNHREEPLEEEEPMEEGELNLGCEPELAVKPIEERNLPDPPREEPEVQVESDIEMWEPKREKPTYMEISSENE